VPRRKKRNKHTTLHQRNARQKTAAFFFISHIPCQSHLFPELGRCSDLFPTHDYFWVGLFLARGGKNQTARQVRWDRTHSFLSPLVRVHLHPRNQPITTHALLRQEIAFRLPHLSIFFKSGTHTHTHPARTGSCRRCSSTLQQHRDIGIDTNVHGTLLCWRLFFCLHI